MTFPESNRGIEILSRVDFLGETIQNQIDLHHAQHYFFDGRTVEHMDTSVHYYTGNAGNIPTRNSDIKRQIKDCIDSFYQYTQSLASRNVLVLTFSSTCIGFIAGYTLAMKR